MAPSHRILETDCWQPNSSTVRRLQILVIGRLVAPAFAAAGRSVVDDEVDDEYDGEDDDEDDDTDTDDHPDVEVVGADVTHARARVLLVAHANLQPHR